MRRPAAVLAAFALMITTAPAAVAGPSQDTTPEVVFADTIVNDVTFPFEFEPGELDPGPCDFGGEPYSLSEVVKVRETEFFNRDGTLKWATLHINGTSTWTGPTGNAVTEHWAWNGRRVETEDGIVFYENGNFWNIHDPGSGTGVILHEKGRHIVTVTFVDDGEPIVDFAVVGGPHEVDENGLGALCEAIA